MPSHCLRNLSLLALILAAASSAYAGDLKVASVIRFQNGDVYSSVRYYRGERVRMEWRDQATWKPGLVTYGPRRATIYQCDAQRVIELNLEAHKYSTAELNERCRGKAAPPPEAKGIVNIYIERTDTGERRQILGRSARHIITHERQVAGPQACWSDAEMDVDGWYIDMPEQPADKKLRNHTNNEAEPLTMSWANCRDKIEVHRAGIEKPGFPVKTVKTSRSSKLQPDGSRKEYTSRWEFEVTELSEAPLDAALFDLPANFSRVAKIDARPSVPFSVEVGYWWNDVVRTVSSWF
jgi:hypothetical protein